MRYETFKIPGYVFIAFHCKKYQTQIEDLKKRLECIQSRVESKQQKIQEMVDMYETAPEKIFQVDQKKKMIYHLAEQTKYFDQVKIFPSFSYTLVNTLL